MTTTLATTLAPTTTTRPASFDAMLLKYRPGLRAMAFRMGYRGEACDDIVTDTIIHCLKHWRTHRPEHGVWGYLQWTMRGVIRGQRLFANRRPLMFEDPDGRRAARMSTQPNQEDHVELTQVLDMVKGRDRDILLRRALTDDTLDVIGAEYGISRSRVNQIEVRARAAVVAGVGAMAGAA